MYISSTNAKSSYKYLSDKIDGVALDGLTESDLSLFNISSTGVVTGLKTAQYPVSIGVPETFSVERVPTGGVTNIRVYNADPWMIINYCDNYNIYSGYLSNINSGDSIRFNDYNELIDLLNNGALQSFLINNEADIMSGFVYLYLEQYQENIIPGTDYSIKTLNSQSFRSTSNWGENRVTKYIGTGDSVEVIEEGTFGTTGALKGLKIGKMLNTFNVGNNTWRPAFPKTMRMVSVHSENNHFMDLNKNVLLRKNGDLVAVFGDGNIPPTVTTIGSRALECSSKKVVAIPNSVNNIQSLAFGRNDVYLTEEEMKRFGVTTRDLVFNEGGSSALILNSEAFSSGGLTSIRLPSDREVNIGSHALAYNYLKNITLPKSVSNIGNYAFAGNIFLETIDFDEQSTIRVIQGFQEVGTWERKIKRITIPRSVTSVAESCFANSNIEELRFQSLDNSLILNGNAFSQSMIDKLVIPAKLKSLNSLAFNEAHIGEIELLPTTGTPQLTTENGMLFTGNNGMTLVYVASNAGENRVVPAHVTNIIASGGRSLVFTMETGIKRVSFEPRTAQLRIPTTVFSGEFTILDFSNLTSIPTFFHDNNANFWPNFYNMAFIFPDNLFDAFVQAIENIMNQTGMWLDEIFYQRIFKTSDNVEFIGGFTRRILNENLNLPETFVNSFATQMNYKTESFRPEMDFTTYAGGNILIRNGKLCYALACEEMETQDLAYLKVVYDPEKGWANDQFRELIMHFEFQPIGANTDQFTNWIMANSIGGGLVSGGMRDYPYWSRQSMYELEDEYVSSLVIPVTGEWVRIRNENASLFEALFSNRESEWFQEFFIDCKVIEYSEGFSSTGEILADDTAVVLTADGSRYRIFDKEDQPVTRDMLYESGVFSGYQPNFHTPDTPLSDSEIPKELYLFNHNGGVNYGEFRINNNFIPPGVRCEVQTDMSDGSVIVRFPDYPIEARYTFHNKESENTVTFINVDNQAEIIRFYLYEYSVDGLTYTPMTVLLQSTNTGAEVQLWRV